MVKKPPFRRRCAAERATAATGRRDLAALSLLIAAALASANAEAALASSPRDPLNPTCPKVLDWSTYRQMRFSLFETEARRILSAEGTIDANAATRLAG